MKHGGDIDRARREAQALWIHSGRPGPRALDLPSIAAQAGLTIVRGGLDGAVARLTYRDGAGFIRLGGQQSTARERFSIAHELGHAWLHKTSALCDETDLANVHRDQAKENEANAFAAELLMPSRLVETAHSRKHLTMDLVLDVANQFDVSVTAAALALMNVTRTACAVVMCSNLGRATTSTVNWYRRHPDFWPSIGAIVPSESAAHGATRGPSAERELEIETWCRRPQYATTQVLFEEVLPIASIGAALVLLTLGDPD